MNRRNPTRIELKLEDLDEFHHMRKEPEEGAGAKDAAVNTDHSSNPTTGTKSPPRTNSNN